MGHLSNPISLRLSVSRTWLVSGISFPYHHPEELHKSLLQIAQRIFKLRPFQRAGIIFSHIVVRKQTLPMQPLVFLYDAHFEIIMNEYFPKFCSYLYRWCRREWLIICVKKKKIKKKKKALQHKRFEIVRSYLFPKGQFKLNIIKPFFPGYQIVRNLVYQNMRGHLFYDVINKRQENRYASWVTGVKNSLKFNIALVQNANITARILANFAIRKLRAKNKLGEIWFPIFFYLQPFFSGMRLLARGRFSRRERSAKRVLWFGVTPRRTFSAQVDYWFASIPLRFGVGAMKIWITRQ